MEIISTIINTVNSHFKKGVKAYISGSTETINLFPVADISRLSDGKMAPMVNVGDGELVPVLELDYPLTGYHKQMETNFKTVQDFGGLSNLSVEINSQFVLLGKRENLNIDVETFALYASLVLGGINAKDLKTTYYRGGVHVNKYTTDLIAILTREFTTKNFDEKYFNPEYFAVRINYTLNVELSGNCLTC